VDARAGEAPHGGAATAAAAAAAARSVVAPSAATRSLARAEETKATGIGGGVNDLGFRGKGCVVRFLIRRQARAFVDLDPTAEIVPRVCGLVLAQAGERNGGPGPGWLGPEPHAHAEPCAGARGPGLSRPCASESTRRGLGCCAEEKASWAVLRFK
jgi:hypothetical protein